MKRPLRSPVTTAGTTSIIRGQGLCKSLSCKMFLGDTISSQTSTSVVTRRRPSSFLPTKDPGSHESIGFFRWHGRCFAQGQARSNKLASQTEEPDMNRTAEINAIIEKAKQQRAEYIGTKIQENALPVALAAVLSLALVQFAAGPSPDQAHEGSLVQFDSQAG